MAYEIDGNGNILVHTFTVTQHIGDDPVSESISARFVDYAQGWDWARQVEREVHENDPELGTDNEWIVDIDYESEWLPENEEWVED